MQPEAGRAKVVAEFDLTESSTMSTTHPLTPFFAPTGVAVVGASARPESVGHALLRNLLFGASDGREVRSEGFAGPVYPVNRKGGELLGEPVVASIGEIDGPLDLVLIAIPGKYVPQVIDECAAVGVRHVIVISAGFAEIGEEGKALQDAMMARARAAGIRIIGPNCLGVIRGSSLNASFGAAAPPAGGIGLLSQSGALITGIISYAHGERFGLSAAVSLGAKADIDDEEIVDFLAGDPETKAIAVYAEAFTEPTKVYESLRNASRIKPVVAIKGGSSAAGAKAASSHTGALAGSSAAYQAAFAQAGVLQANTIGEFMAWSRALAVQPPAKGKRLAIVTNAGGPGVLSADAASRCGLTLATLAPETIAALNEVLPSVWSHNNPVDVIGDATAERYRDALNIIGAADEVDGIVVIMTVQAMTAPRETAQAIIDAHANPAWTKPLTASFIGLAGSEVGGLLDAAGVPEFNVPETAVSAMGALMERGAWLAAQETDVVAPSLPPMDTETIEAALAEARAGGQKNLDLALARKVLAATGLRYNGSGTAADAEEAIGVAEGIGYPVVIKLISPDVIHKSDVGGVVLNVAGPAEVREACAGIRERVEAAHPGARITGFTVEEQVSGTEIIIGMSRDPGFGPLMMVGMGGVFVEVYKDVAFRLVPLTHADALEMIGEIRAQALFDGARKRPVLNRDELAAAIVRIAELVQRYPEIAEVDLNPLVVTTDGLVAIDARVIL